MATKILVTCSAGLSKDSIEAKKQAIADQLGVCCEHIVIVPDGWTVAVAEIPDVLCKKAKEETPAVVEPVHEPKGKKSV